MARTWREPPSACRIRSMHEDLIAQARETKLWRGALEGLAASLPGEVETLTQILTELLAARDNEAFTALLLAGLHAGRPLPAHLLVEGAALLPDPGYLVTIAWKMSGNVAQALVKAVERGTMANERELISLLAAALWCETEDHKADLPMVITRGRIFARNPFLSPEDKRSLSVLAELMGDEGLKALMPPPHRAEAAILTRVMKERLMVQARQPVLRIVPDKPLPNTVSGYTVRRAVARVGRNDPCPCGSGKKYKQCCLEKDHARLAQSSPVPGLTVAEFKSQRERYLTSADLLKMRSYELARLDPAKVAPELLPILVNSLLRFRENEHVVRLFETTGLLEPIAEHWHDALHDAATQRRPDLVQRLIKLKPDFDPAGEDGSLEVRLALLDATANPALDVLEAEALAALQPSKRTDTLIDIGYALLSSRYPALGILVSRGIVPIVGGFDAETLHEVLLETRDRLNLDFRDPIDPLVGMRASEEAEHAAEDSAELARARANIEEKNREVGRVRQELERVKAELLKRLEPTPAPVSTPHPLEAAAAPLTPPLPPQDTVTQALRQRVEGLKEELKARHGERNELRRELDKVTQDLAAMREKAAVPAEPAAPEAPDSEGALFREADFESNQPVRVPEYADRFRDALQDVAKPVARAAILLVGRLAAGQPAAFAGVRKLEANHQILRQRVGADYRLLFRLTPDALQVLALVNRRDLDRQIRNLFATN